MSYKFDKDKYSKFAKKCFKVINGKINTVIKAKEIKILDKKRIILTDMEDSVTVATAGCNVIYFDIRMLEYLCEKVEFSDFEIRSLIIHFMAHELSHLDQIMSVNDMLTNEIANELNTLKFLYKNAEYLIDNLCDFDIGDIDIADDLRFKRMKRNGIESSYSKYIIGMTAKEAATKFPYIKAKDSLEKFNDDAKVFLGKIDLYKVHEENVKCINLLVVNQYRNYTRGFKFDLKELFNSNNERMDKMVEDIYTFVENEIFVGYNWSGYMMYDQETQSICYEYDADGMAEDGYASNFEFFIPKDGIFDHMYDRIRIE